MGTRRPRSTWCASRGNALADVPARPRVREGALARVRRAASASPRVRRRPSAVPRRRRLFPLARRPVIGIPARGARALAVDARFPPARPPRRRPRRPRRRRRRPRPRPAGRGAHRRPGRRLGPPGGCRRARRVGILLAKSPRQASTRRTRNQTTLARTAHHHRRVGPRIRHRTTRQVDTPRRLALARVPRHLPPCRPRPRSRRRRRRRVDSEPILILPRRFRPRGALLANPPRAPRRRV